MKKVIILCSALVFDFLIFSDASAYNARREAAEIERELTTLISLVNGQEEKEAIVQRYSDMIKNVTNTKLINWMGSKDLVIVNGKVEFTKKFVRGKEQVTQPYPRRGDGCAQRILDEIRGDIVQRRAEQAAILRQQQGQRRGRFHLPWNRQPENPEQPQPDAQPEQAQGQPQPENPGQPEQAAILRQQQARARQESEQRRQQEEEARAQREAEQQAQGQQQDGAQPEPAQGQQQAEAQDNASAPSSNDSTPSISRRSSVAKETHPEPANLIPWSSQNSSSGQDYAENNRIEGRTGTLALPAPDNRTEEGNSRLALPAPQGNSENQRHQVEEGNSENSEPSSNDSTPSSSRRSSLTNSESSDNMNGYNYDDYMRERRNQEDEETQGQQQAEDQRSLENAPRPEPANLVPWSSQNSSSGQDYAENNRIEGRTGTLALPAPDNRIEGGNSRLALPAPQGNSENQRHQSEPSSNDSTPSISRRSSVAKETHPEPANLIPWSSQNSSSGQDYAENNRIEGRTGTLALPAPDNRTEEGNSRLALPAPQGNSENQRHQVEEGNSENSEPSSNDSTPSISRRSSVAKETHPEPANLIPWSSQNSSSGQDYAENNRIEGRTGTLALPALDNRTEGGNSRLALPAPQGNSENQRHQVEEGNSENSEANSSTTSISRRSSLTNSESSDSMNGYNYDDYMREGRNQEDEEAQEQQQDVAQPEQVQGQQQAGDQDNASAPSSNDGTPSSSLRSSDSSNSDSDRNSESLSNDSTPSISRQSSFFSNSDGYPTKEEEQKATDTEIIDKNREPGTQEDSASSENNGTNTNSFGQDFLRHYREEFGDFPSYDPSSSSSRRSSVSSTNSKFSNADHQSDSGNESSSNDANGFGSTFSNHYNDSLFDN